MLIKNLGMVLLAIEGQESKVRDWYRELLKYRANEEAAVLNPILNLNSWPFQLDCML